MRGAGGYGRYNDDPECVECPRARSDMTPCIARDGSSALAAADPACCACCVGCGQSPTELLAELDRVAGGVTILNPRRPGPYARKAAAADALARRVRQLTKLNPTP